MSLDANGQTGGAGVDSLSDQMKILNSAEDKGHQEERCKEEIKDALINPYILKTVLSYVDAEALKACRGVSRSWHQLATPIFRQKAMIYFDEHYDEEDPPEEIQENIENQFYRDVRNYMKSMQNFHVESYCLGKGAKYTEQLEEIEQFFRKFGPFIKHLRLDYEFHSHFNVDLLRKHMTEYLPILEHLDIRNMPVSVGQMTKHGELTFVRNSSVGHGTPDEFPVFWPRSVGPRRTFPNIRRIDVWNYNAYVGELGRNFVEDLLQIAPNLECIEIVDRYYTSMVNFFLKALLANPTWVPKLSQILLDGCGNPTMDDIKLLSQLNLKLKVLRLGTLPDMNQSSFFQTILNKQSPTLEELQFGNYVGNTPIRLTLPNFPRLKKLELTQDVSMAARYNITFDPVNYKQQFPMLMELGNCRSQRYYQYDDLNSLQRYKSQGKGYFKGMGDLWKTLFPDDGQVCKTLRILDIPYPRETTALVRRLAKMFPDVNNLELNEARRIE